MRQLIKYPGSKWSLTDWITSFFPWHHGYCGMDIITGKVHKAKFRKEKSEDGEQIKIGGMI